MHRLLYLTLLCSCTPPPRYAVVRVFDPTTAPVGEAMVATDCGQFHGYGMRTDETGFARVQVDSSVAAQRCVVTVAKPGYHTVETDGVQLCTTATCPPLIVE